MHGEIAGRDLVAVIQPTGNDTGTPVRTVAVPATTGRPDPRRVDEHLAAAASFMNAVVATPDRVVRRAPQWLASRRPRLPSARVVDRDEDLYTLGPAGLDGTFESQIDHHLVTRWQPPTAMENASFFGRVEVEHEMGPVVGTVDPHLVGCYSTARWLANHNSVRRSLHSA